MSRLINLKKETGCQIDFKVTDKKGELYTAYHRGKSFAVIVKTPVGNLNVWTTLNNYQGSQMDHFKNFNGAKNHLLKVIESICENCASQTYMVDIKHLSKF